MRITTWAKILLRFLERKRGIVWRALLSWTIGMLVLMNDERNSYDLRFLIRGNQPINEEIVVIKINSNEMPSSAAIRTNRFSAVNEMADITDSFFWNRRVWNDLLKKVLDSKPKFVGVSLYFGDYLGPLTLTTNEQKLFYDPRVIWASLNDDFENNRRPLFTDENQANIGNIDLLRDEDGVIRKFLFSGFEHRSLIEKLAREQNQLNNLQLINYRGFASSLREFTLTEILEQQVSPRELEGKIVLIGSEANSTAQFLTPLGGSHRAEVLANILDNQLSNRWIKRAPFIVYAFGLALLTILSVLIMTQYPQTIALVFLWFVATLVTAISLWVFDSFYFWIPIISPDIQIAGTYVIFLGYQANKIEQRHWELQQEQAYLAKLEQLKNNFISLISHDLKTPIAKIQAIVDRRIASTNDPLWKDDLELLRQSGHELNRYIQSILHLLRVESRDFKIHPEVGDINEICLSAAQSLKPLALQKTIQIDFDLEPMFSIEFDHTLMKEVILNLIENAIKYSPASGSVVVRTRDLQNEVLVEIQDSGQGITSEEIPLVWGKFVRGKGEDLKTKGTGLGLYLVRYFIELHGGKVWLESEAGKGTRVSFSLPVDTGPEVSTSETKVAILTENQEIQ